MYRDGRFGGPLRRIFDDGACVECAHHGSNAVCCGAAGAVSLVDQGICDRRARRALDEEPRAAGAELVVANCPRHYIVRSSWVIGEGKNFGFVWDGANLDMDYWVIPKGAPNMEAAQKFMEGKPAKKVVVVPGRLVNIVA